MKITFTSVRKEDIKFFKEKLKNFHVEFYEETIDKIPLEKIEDSEILSVFVFDRLTEDILSKFKHLKLIITRSAGYDHIDLDYCKRHKIRVAHMPAYSPKSIAEHTIALLLTLTRNIKKISKRTENLDFSQSEEIIAVDLDELKIGIIGTGRIGSWTAKLSYYLGMEVLAHDIVKNEGLESLGVKYVQLEELLSSCDVVTLHVPYTTETHHLINKDRLSLMKEGAILINTSRGAVVDTNSLYDAVISGKLSGVGLDVFEDEDILILSRYEEGLSSDKNLKILKLNALDNVILTPHVAYYTKRAVKNIRKCTVECINLFMIKNELGRFKVI